jgi:hypothetical protein
MYAPQQPFVPHAAPDQACRGCGRHAATKQLTFLQNIGVLVVRFPRTASGAMCRFCADRFFWRYTTITMLLGWWGVISFFTSLVAVPLNLVNYFRSMALPYPPHDVQSASETHTRATLLLVGGILGGLLALAGIGLDALATLADGDVAGGAVAFLLVLVFFGLPSGLMLHAAVRGLGARAVA